jgi:hypothetical protein
VIPSAAVEVIDRIANFVLTSRPLAALALVCGVLGVVILIAESSLKGRKS